MTESLDPPQDAEPVFDAEISGEGWSGADIEQAYLKALGAMEDLPCDEAPALEGGSVSAQEAAAASNTEGDAPEGPLLAVAQTPEPPEPAANEAPAGAQADDGMISPAGPHLAPGTESASGDSSEQHALVTPSQIIEAALFVGGAPLTARKLCGLLRGSFDTAFVEKTIDELNAAYRAQARPYEIRLGEGGYRLELQGEFDRLRHRVYGAGPREVRLSQEVLEVLALVAYRQPISQSDIESHGKENAGNLLRQLLRRDLLAFERGPGGRKDVKYHTTARFLSVFGLGSLDELPQAEDLAKK